MQNDALTFVEKWSNSEIKTCPAPIAGATLVFIAIMLSHAAPLIAEEMPPDPLPKEENKTTEPLDPKPSPDALEQHGPEPLEGISPYRRRAIMYSTMLHSSVTAGMLFVSWMIGLSDGRVTKGPVDIHACPQEVLDGAHSGCHAAAGRIAHIRTGIGGRTIHLYAFLILGGKCPGRDNC